MGTENRSKEKNGMAALWKVPILVTKGLGFKALGGRKMRPSGPHQERERLEQATHTTYIWSFHEKTQNRKIFLLMKNDDMELCHLGCIPSGVLWVSLLRNL